MGCLIEAGMPYAYLFGEDCASLCIHVTAILIFTRISQFKTFAGTQIISFLGPFMNIFVPSWPDFDTYHLLIKHGSWKAHGKFHPFFSMIFPARNVTLGNGMFQLAIFDSRNPGTQSLELQIIACLGSAIDHRWSHTSMQLDLVGGLEHFYFPICIYIYIIYIYIDIYIYILEIIWNNHPVPID